MSDGAFWFLVANDLHYTDAEDGPWLARLVEQMNGHPEQPEFLLLLGDLVEAGQPAQFAAVRAALDRLAMPVYPVIGNHDYGPGDDRSAWDAAFGQRSYRFTHQDWELIGLDSTVGNAYEEISIPRETFDWLDTELPHIPAERPILLFTHFPLAEGVRWRPLNAGELLDRFAGRRLIAAFSGHFHGAVQQTRAGVLLVNGRCCARARANHDGAPEKGYLLCRAQADEVTTEFIRVPQDPREDAADPGA